MANRPNYAKEIERLTSRISELEQENANLRRLDESIRRNTAMFEAMMANSSAGIALMGPDRRIVKIVRAAMGFGRNDLVGLPVETLIHPEDQEILVDCYEQLLRGSAKSVEFEGRLWRPDGSLGWVVAKFTDMLDDPNVQAIVCNYSDVTEQRQRDLLLAEFAVIVESADSAVFSKDLDGRILTWNQSAQKLYGYSSDEVGGGHIWMLVPKELREEEQKTRGLIRETALPLQFRTIRVCKGGSRIPVLVQLIPVLDRYGRAQGISHSSKLLCEPTL